MENSTSYSISEAAELLNLSSKTIRRYIKSGKLPSIKVPTKFGDEYRVTEIPEALRQEAEAQAKVDIVPAKGTDSQLDTQKLYQENIRLAAQLGAASERIRQLEGQLKEHANRLTPVQERVRVLEGQLKLFESIGDQLKRLEAPKKTPRRPRWKRIFGK